MARGSFYAMTGRILCRESVPYRFGNGAYDEAEAGYDMKRQTCSLEPAVDQSQVSDESGSTFPCCSDHSLFRY
jgi:hypothetical protein